MAAALSDMLMENTLMRQKAFITLRCFIDDHSVLDHITHAPRLSALVLEILFLLFSMSPSVMLSARRFVASALLFSEISCHSHELFNARSAISKWLRKLTGVLLFFFPS